MQDHTFHVHFDAGTVWGRPSLIWFESLQFLSNLISNPSNIFGMNEVMLGSVFSASSVGLNSTQGILEQKTTNADFIHIRYCNSTQLVTMEATVKSTSKITLALLECFFTAYTRCMQFSCSKLFLFFCTRLPLLNRRNLNAHWPVQNWSSEMLHRLTIQKTSWTHRPKDINSSCDAVNHLSMRCPRLWNQCEHNIVESVHSLLLDLQRTLLFLWKNKNV